jgi:hypothetical protein
VRSLKTKPSARPSSAIAGREQNGETQLAAPKTNHAPAMHGPLVASYSRARHTQSPPSTGALPLRREIALQERTDMKRSMLIVSLSVAALVLSSAALARGDEVVRSSPHKIQAAKTSQSQAAFWHRVIKTGK